MNTYNIGFCGQIRKKYQYFMVEISTLFRAVTMIQDKLNGASRFIEGALLLLHAK